MNYLSIYEDEKQIQEAISNKFIQIRENNNLTQQKFAEKLDVSVEHISRIENCKYTCSITLIFKVCSIFNFTIDEFFDISLNKKDNITEFMDRLSLEKREAIMQFLDEIQSTYKKN